MQSTTTERIAGSAHMATTSAPSDIFQRKKRSILFTLGRAVGATARVGVKGGKTLFWNFPTGAVAGYGLYEWLNKDNTDVSSDVKTLIITQYNSLKTTEVMRERLLGLTNLTQINLMELTNQSL